MHFNKVLNHSKVGSSETKTSFLRFILVPIHFSASSSNFHGVLINLNSIPRPINSNRNHIKSFRKPRNFEKEPR